MSPDVITFSSGSLLSDAVTTFASDRGVQHQNGQHRQRLYPVLDDQCRFAGVLTRRDILDAALAGADGKQVADLMVAEPVTVYPDQTLREAAYLFARHGITRAPVIDRADPARVVGLITLTHLLQGRLRDLQEERISERVLRMSPSSAFRRGRTLSARLAGARRRRVPGRRASPAAHRASGFAARAAGVSGYGREARTRRRWRPRTRDDARRRWRSLSRPTRWRAERRPGREA